MEKTAERQPKKAERKLLKLDKVVPVQKKVHEKRKNEFLGSPEFKQKKIEQKLSAKFEQKGLYELNNNPEFVSAIAGVLYENQANYTSLDGKISEIALALEEAKKSVGMINSYFDGPSYAQMAKFLVSNPSAVPKFAQTKLGSDFLKALVPLADSIAAKCYSSHPDAIIEMAQKFGLRAISAYGAFSQPEIADLFNSDPKRFMALFDELGKKAGIGAESYVLHFAQSYALSALKQPGIAKFFAKDPEKFIYYIDKIREAVSSGSTNAQDDLNEALTAIYDSFSQPAMARFFATDPEKFISSIAELSKAIGKSGNSSLYWAFNALSQPEIAELFVSRPEKLISYFSLIDKASQNSEISPFIAFSNLHPGVVKLFASNPDAFVKMAQATGKFAGIAFASLSLPGMPAFFNDYCQGKMGFEQFMIQVKSTNDYSIELGKPLDELHDDQPALVQRYGTDRNGYLASLDKTDVLALLCSDPSFFYTSSNQMLFGRLLQDSNGESIVKVMDDYGIWDAPASRNLIFRAINYGRFFGRANYSIFSESDLEKVMPKLTAPLYEKGFDPDYFYKLANGIEHMGYEQKKSMRGILDDAGGKLPAPGSPEWVEWGNKKSRAISILASMLDHPGRNTSGQFDASRYKGSDGKKLLIVQVFDKEDTLSIDENGKPYGSWLSSQNWWRKYLKTTPTDAYGKPVKELLTVPGELTYDSGDVRMVLYMGDTPGDNQQFISKMLADKKNMIITFRGHSYSLAENFPDSIFAPFPSSNILFMPGSCGSVGSIPSYLASNQFMDTISNTSSGEGFITNTVMELLIEEARRDGHRLIKEILVSDKEKPISNAARIKKVNGDASTLSVSTWGDFLLKEIYHPSH